MKFDPKLFLLYASAFLTIAGFGMVFPLLPFYAERFGASSLQLGMLAASFSIAQFLVSPFLGRYSDRFGRKPILALALLGTTVSFAIFGFAHSLFWLFISRILHGIASAGVFPIAAAYVGDIAAKEDRVRYMGQLNGMFALGFVVGPALSGTIPSPFFIAAVLSALTFLFILFFLPESLKSEARRIASHKGFIDIPALFRAFRGEFGVFFFLLFSWAFAISNFQIALPLFAQSHFGFHEKEVGFLFAFSGIIAVCMQWIWLPQIVRKLKKHVAIMLGTFLMAIGQALIAFSFSSFSLFIFLSISTLGGALLRPVINTLLSEETKEGQGSTMGLGFSFESLGRIVGPMTGGFLISSLGLANQFVMTGVLLFIGALFLMSFLLSKKNHTA